MFELVRHQRAKKRGPRQISKVWTFGLLLLLNNPLIQPECGVSAVTTESQTASFRQTCMVCRIQVLRQKLKMLAYCVKSMYAKYNYQGTAFDWFGLQKEPTSICDTISITWRPPTTFHPFPAASKPFNAVSAQTRSQPIMQGAV